MTAVRQDAWTPDDDLILAETTLRHIREGSTQLAAFEEVGEKIGRTAAACGFRWNSCVRKNYEAAIQLAKAQRQKRNQAKKTGAAHRSHDIMETEAGDGMKPASAEETLSIDAVIRFLRHWKGTYQEMNRQIRHFQKELREKEEELTRLRKENEELRKQVDSVESDYRTVNDDYKALIKIMDRARKLAILTDEDEEHKPIFKMDANGNLERVE